MVIAPVASAAACFRPFDVARLALLGAAGSPEAGDFDIKSADCQRPATISAK
jgi:hypothetical protein